MQYGRPQARDRRSLYEMGLLPSDLVQGVTLSRIIRMGYGGPLLKGTKKKAERSGRSAKIYPNVNVIYCMSFSSRCLAARASLKAPPGTSPILIAAS